MPPILRVFSIFLLFALLSLPTQGFAEDAPDTLPFQLNPTPDAQNLSSYNAEASESQEKTGEITEDNTLNPVIESSPVIQIGDFGDDNSQEDLWDSFDNEAFSDNNAIVIMGRPATETLNEPPKNENAAYLGVQGLPDPTYIIESITFIGNRYTTDENILRIAQLAQGDYINLSVLNECRLKLLASGIFTTATIHLASGTEPNKIRLIIEITETERFHINNIWLGSSQENPFWMGFDVSNRSLADTRHTLRMAFVASTRSHYALNISFFTPKLASTAFMLGAHVFVNENEENIGFLYKNNNPQFIENQDYIELLRAGGSIFTGYSFDNRINLTLAIRSEYLNAHFSPLDLQSLLVKRGSGVLTTLGVSLSYDSRKTYITPISGHLIRLGVLLSHDAVLSDYRFAKFTLMHQSNITFHDQHTLRIGSFLGYILGTAPYFELFYVGDFYDLQPERALQINLSSSAPFDLFNMGANQLAYEKLLAKISLEYAYVFPISSPLLKKMEFFVQIGLLGATSFKLYSSQTPNTLYPFPLNGTANAGLRIETSFGFFALSLSKLMDLIPR